MTSLFRARCLGAALLVVSLACSSAVVAQTSAATAKRDSIARADSIKKAVAKRQADDKAAAKKTAEAKAAAAKAATKQTAAKAPASTTTKPAAPAGKEAGSASVTKAAGSGTAKPAATAKGTAAKPAGSGKAAATRAGGAAAQSTALADDGPARGVYAGASAAGLGFGTAPVFGVAWRLAAPTSSIRLRAELMGAHYGQTAAPFVGAPPITERASLTHVGAALSVVLNLSSSRSMRPYVIVGGGVFRFQASGQAGGNGTIVNGIFTSTTDVAGIAGLGLQLAPRFTVEARYLTVGDFHTLPITIGVRF